MTLGIVGAGAIGTAVAKLATAAGIEVVLANSRGPASLRDLVAELGPLARAATLDQAATAGPVTVLAVPPTAVPSLPAGAFGTRAVLDTSNYYPYRDGRIAELDAGGLTSAEYVQTHLPQARVVKSFSNILAQHIPLLARPSAAPDRSALPVAGDDEQAKALVIDLLDRLGYDGVEAGSAAQAWRFEPETTAYTPIYLAAPLAPGEDIFSAAVSPTSRQQLLEALARAQRVNVADRAH